MSQEFREGSYACALALCCFGFFAGVVFGDLDMGIAAPIGAMIMWLGE